MIELTYGERMRRLRQRHKKAKQALAKEHSMLPSLAEPIWREVAILDLEIKEGYKR